MASVAEPFPISLIAGRYLLFDIDTVSYARRAHNICGVLIGTLPNLSQQNVFLGLPLELMPEEARVLVEQDHAYIVDDAEHHKKGFLDMSKDDRLAYLQHMDRLGMETAQATRAKLDERRDKALKQKGLTPETAGKDAQSAPTVAAPEEETLFGPSVPLCFAPKEPMPPQVETLDKKLDPHFVTPATSYPPLSQPPVDSALPVPAVPGSYPLFRYMHSKGYFSTPGLRFGCHYTIYPGDPLRFHSHFLATGLGWDEKFDLIDLVGGGRLGTGVKKGYLLGGEDPMVDAAKTEPVRAFSIEWAGM